MSFTYCWTDHKTNKLYVGVHKGTTTDGYICSSKKMMEQYKVRPNDFSRQIIANGNYQDMLVLEAKILASENARYNDHYYNEHNGNGKFTNKGHSDVTKEKLRNHRHSDATKQLIKEARLRQKDPRIGKKHSEETKKRIALKKIGQQCHTKSITICGIFYATYKEAAEKLGVSAYTITRRVKRGMYV